MSFDTASRTDLDSSPVSRGLGVSPRSEAIAAFAAGEVVVLFDRESAFLVFAAATSDTKTTSFVIEHGSGFLQVALPVNRCDRLQIPEAAPTERDQRRSAFGQCVGVDAAFGIGTGISARDRARTARVLSDSAAVPEDLTRPGHVIVVRVCEGESTVYSSALQLALEAGCVPAVVVTELVHPVEQVRMADGVAAERFASRYGLCTLSRVDAALFGSK